MLLLCSDLVQIEVRGPQSKRGTANAMGNNVGAEKSRKYFSHELEPADFYDWATLLHSSNEIGLLLRTVLVQIEVRRLHEQTHMEISVTKLAEQNVTQVADCAHRS